MAHQHTHPHTPRLHQRPRPHPPGRSFLLVNGLSFAVHLLLACTAQDLLGTRVVGQITFGVIALLAQVLLLLWTAARYDRALHGRAHDETPDGDTSDDRTPYGAAPYGETRYGGVSYGPREER
ncbi:hypothetical protein ACFYNL_20765 [Streptomyces sp. NPDC007808]|uniref:hypothetical protein n=1 Tax=Streptomyces sp. NPDC007808 TaxID=3364779 RepID=UPI0036BF9C7A